MFGRSRRVSVDEATVPVGAPSPRSFLRTPNDALQTTTPPPPPVRRRRHGSRGGMLSLLSGLTTLGLVVAGALLFGVLTLERDVDEPGPLGADKVVLIPKNTGTSEITELLEREGVIDHPRLFELYAYYNRKRGSLKAGEYQFRATMTLADVVDTLIAGRSIQHSFTAPEGLTSEQIVQRLRDNDVLSGDLNEVPREGTLLPDTYKFDRGTTRQQVVNMMQSAERQMLAQVWARRTPDLPIKTPQELIILASIVEKETARPDERPRVASVFVNRLARRMKLQSDPTIVYGIVGGKGTLGRSILRSDIDRATPYNTYAIEGLPPGPIANPGRAALEAVANPLKTKEVFFVADGTGGHAFAESYDQHQRNVARYRQIERARDAGSPAAAPVDRVDPQVAPDTRTDLDPGGAAAPARSASSNIDGTPAPRQAAFDAVEGTNRDPLRNRSWDLSSPKTVPGVGPDPAAQAPRREAVRAAARPQPRARARAAASSQQPLELPTPQ